MNGTRTLAVANHEEFYAPYADALPPAACEKWRLGARRAASGALFWGVGPAVALLPAPPDFFTFEVLAPALREGRAVVAPEPALRPGASLCEAVMDDAALRCRLLASLTGASRVRVAAWGDTPALRRMLGLLRREGAPPLDLSDEAGPSWTGAWLGSKVGFLQFCRRHRFPHPEASLASTVAEAAALVSAAARGGQSVVIKPDRSVAGTGLVRCDAGRVPASGWPRWLSALSRNIPEWGAGLLLVEEFVEGPEGAARSVSAQCEADGEGGGRVRFLAAHERDERGILVGAALGRGALEPGLARRLRHRALAVCRAASRLGHAGVFGLDFAVNRALEPLPLEMNARRTTLTAAADIAEGLFGPRWATRAGVVAAEDFYFDPRRLRGELQNLLFPVGGRPEGWIPFPALDGTGGAGFRGGVALAPDAARARRLVAEVRRRLG